MSLVRQPFVKIKCIGEESDLPSWRQRIEVVAV